MENLPTLIGIAVYAATVATRLELCWSRAAAPDGPSVPTPARQNTRVDLSPGYPIALFRWFSPNPTEFLNVTQNDILNFYIARAMIKIWTWPDANLSPRYDVVGGASKYGVGVFGGSFSLVDWMNKKFPTLNCYDLAGISQLACAILVNQNGDEIVDSHWVLQFPNGYVNPGPLYGWNRVNDGRNHMACNNPFWAAGGQYSKYHKTLQFKIYTYSGRIADEPPPPLACRPKPRRAAV